MEELGLATEEHHSAKFKTPVEYLKKNSDAPDVIHDFALAHEIIKTSSKSDTVKNLTGKTGQFAFLKRLHYLGSAADYTIEDTQSNADFFNTIKDDLAAGKSLSSTCHLSLLISSLR